jgi:hypothetical protein
MRAEWHRWVAPAALAIALLSLAGNAVLLWQLRHPERWAAPAAARMLERWLGADTTLRHTVRIPAGTPLRVDIPVNERFAIRVDTVIPINTTVRVPLRGPLGTYNVTLPIRARVPLRTSLPLHVRHTFQLRTRTREEIAIPIQIRLGELLEGMGR